MANLENARGRSTERATHPSLKTKTYRMWMRLELWLPILLVFTGLVLWEILARADLVSPLFFPAPSNILRNFIKMLSNGKLLIHGGATLQRLTLGFILGGLPGLILGLAMGWSPRLRAAVDPIIAAIHPIPKLAIFPLIMILFGLGEVSRVIVIAISSFFPMLINSMAGVRQLNPVYFEVSQNYGASPWKTFTRIVLPGSLPLVLAGARLSVNMAMVISIGVELIAAEEGLGEIIWFSWQTMRIVDLYASLVAIGVLGIGINFLLQHFSHRLVPWYSDQPEKRY